ncbi:MAG: flagellar biosynthesis protein FliQ [Lachnospiraceae bacterium]|nr:flagellar biosynthesis protein FliQ [Lachnospiraceae bacterium]
MTIDTVTTIASNALFTIIKTAAPLLLISLCVGLTVSIFQTVTSIQEQTLTFVPKVMAIFLTIMLLGHWMMNNMVGYMVSLWENFSLYIR